MTLRGYVALVTGAASGIGYAAADALAAHGAEVIRSDIVATDDCITLDVTQRRAWLDVVSSIEDRHGGLDILVNAAGISLEDDTVAGCSTDTWRRTIAVNLLGAVTGMQAAAPAMMKGRGGAIINITSVLAHRGAGNAAAYSASKGGLLMATKSAALHCAHAKSGIRVNSISPGYIETPMLSGWTTLDAGAVAELQHIRNTIPMRRLGSAAEVANLVVYLASDEARSITGSDFILDGGLSAQAYPPMT